MKSCRSRRSEKATYVKVASFKGNVIFIHQTAPSDGVCVGGGVFLGVPPY
jgi:hypothetical protein